MLRFIGTRRRELQRTIKIIWSLYLNYHRRAKFIGGLRPDYFLFPLSGDVEIEVANQGMIFLGVLIIWN